MNSVNPDQTASKEEMFAVDFHSLHLSICPKY